MIKQVHSQYFYVCKSISIEGVDLEIFKKLKPSAIPMAQFHSYLADESDQDSRTTATHILIIIQLILSKRVDRPIVDNHAGSHIWLRKEVSL